MIEFDGVTKRYPDGTVAVDALDLTIEGGRITAFLGYSGSGKTTILRMINRMVEPSEGRIRIDGEEVAGIEPVALRRRIGYVLQHAGLLPHRTVVQNVATVLRLVGVPPRAAEARALEVMGSVGLDQRLARRYPAELSGGQQQRVGVARALAADPAILLMDEPFGAVDPLVRAELQQELLRLQLGLAKTVVFVTHDVDEAFLLGDRVVLFRPGGRIAQSGTPRELLERTADEFVADFIEAGRPRSILR